MTKKLVILIFLFWGIFLLMNGAPTFADSGWDSDYGGSSSSSSSGFSDDSDFGGSSDFSLISLAFDISILLNAIAFFYLVFSLFNSKLNLFFVIILFFLSLILEIVGILFVSGWIIVVDIIIAFFIMFITRKIMKNRREKLEMQLKKYNLTIEELSKQLYDKFVDIQKAWMEFDYEKLRILCTDELYNSYKSQLEILKLKSGKNIMKEFNLERSNIICVTIIENNIVVKINMVVSFYDYVVNTNTEKVIRGNKDSKVFNNYEMIFVKGVDSFDKVICPGCGALADVNASGKCEYCNNVIVKESYDFVLSSKKLYKK